MKNKFADFETSRMMKALGYADKCFGFYANEGEVHNITDNAWHEHKSMKAEVPVVSPLWQDVEAWLWEKFNIQCRETNMSIGHGWYATYKICGSRDLQTVFDEEMPADFFPSPIEAKIAGLKNAVKWLYEKKQEGIAQSN